MNRVIVAVIIRTQTLGGKPKWALVLEREPLVAVQTKDTFSWQNEGQGEGFLKGPLVHCPPSQEPHPPLPAPHSLPTFAFQIGFLGRMGEGAVKEQLGHDSA